MIRPSGANFTDDLKRYVAKATQLIHSPDTRDNILQMLNGQDPVQSVAKAAVMILQRVDAASRDAGIEVQDTVKTYGAADVVHQLVEVGEAAKKFKMDKDLIEFALAVTVQEYVKSEIAAGRLNGKAAMVAMQSDLRKLPPAKRKEIQQSQQRIQQTARRYGARQQGGGEPQETPQPLMQQAQQPQQETGGMQ